MINYSVIIPFRGHPNLLYKAIASIPERKDVEVIIVDNNLHSLDECDMPKKQQTVVKYFTSEPTMETDRTRNVGLQHAHGRWILFLDADDYFTEKAFTAFDKYKDSGFDIIFFDADSIRLKDGLQGNRHRTIHQLVASYLKTGDKDLLRYRFINPISKMLDANLVLKNNIVFDEIPVSNDVWFSIMTGHAATRITADEAIVYMITVDDTGNSLTQKKSKENWFIRFQVMVRVNQYLKSIGKYKYRIRLLGGLRKAWKEYGFKEFLHLLKYAHNSSVGIL